MPDLTAQSDSLSFIAGTGEMARRIRAFNWSAHPFGPPEGWPQSLRSALSICLDSAFPTAIYWGPDLRLLYNDAWAPVPGPRHPAALGKPAREVWADIWDIIWPQFRQLLERGEGFFAENRLLPMRRYGLEEETYWSYSFSAIRGEDGRIKGIFNCGYETTATVLAQRRLQFMLSFSETVRGQKSADATIAAATAALGAYLRATHVGYCETAPEGRGALAHCWAAPGQAHAKALTIADFGAPLDRPLARGQAVRMEDVQSYCNTIEGDSACAATFAALGARSGIVVPCLYDGRLVFSLYVLTDEARRWDDSDLVTLQEAAERLRDSIAILRHDQHQRLLMREVDHRAKNVLAVVQAVVHLSRADDADQLRRVVDGRIAALARAHDLLAESRWEGLDLRTLIEQELSAFGDGSAVQIEGPSLRLPSELAQIVALAIHELATNAAKYGALRGSGGLLSVTWRHEAGRIIIDWRERANAPIASPQGRRGFGWELLNSSVRRQSGGDITLHWARHGLKCRLEVPLDGARPSASPAVIPADAPDADLDGRPRLLLAEDEALVAMDLEVRLGNLGYRVVANIDTVAAALHAIDICRPDAALLDANLHGESSLPVAVALHRRGVPVIFLTGYDRIEGLPPDLAGLTKLTKPVLDDTLHRSLAAALSS